MWPNLKRAFTKILQRRFVFRLMQIARPTCLQQVDMLGNSAASADLQAVMDRIHKDIHWFSELEEKLREKETPKAGPQAELDPKDD